MARGLLAGLAQLAGLARLDGFAGVAWIEDGSTWWMVGTATACRIPGGGGVATGPVA